MPRQPDDPVAKRVAISLLARGLGSPGEIAEFAGTSRQVVENWARRAGIDWRKIKRANLARAWRNEAAHGHKAVKPTKAQLRREAERAKRKWDAAHGGQGSG